MRRLFRLLDDNRAWADRMRQHDPAFFHKLATPRPPEYFWIGCAENAMPDSAMPGMGAGGPICFDTLGNVVADADMSCLAAIQYAVELRDVKHLVVCGHYGCYAVKAALVGERLGFADARLGSIVEVRDRHAEALGELATTRERWDRLCELNVIEQAMRLGRTPVVRAAWEKEREVVIHGWIYNPRNGILRNLGPTLSRLEDAACAYRQALSRSTAHFR